MQDEQREKQLSPLETVSQILKRSVYTRISQVNDGEGTKPRPKIPNKSPSPYKVDPFVNHLAPFTICDKIKVYICSIQTYEHRLYNILLDTYIPNI